MVSSSSSLTYGEIAEARLSKSQPLFFQLYKQPDDIAIDRVREAEKHGYNAIFLTVDTAALGNRERDVRAPFVLEDQEKEAERLARKEAGLSPDAPLGPDVTEKNYGEPVARLRNTDPDMSWQKAVLFSFSFSSSSYILINLCRRSHG